MKIPYLELVLALMELSGSTLELLRWFLLFSTSRPPSSAPGSSILITFFSFSSLLVEVQDLLIFLTGLALLLPAVIWKSVRNQVKNYLSV